MSNRPILMNPPKNPARNAGKKPEPAKSKGPKPLNIRQERFAEFVARGMPDSQAYIEAGYTKSRKNAEANAWRVKENDGVKVRVAEIRAKDSLREEFTREDLVRHLVAVITTPISRIDKDSPLVQEMTEDVIGGGNRGTLKRGKAASGNEVIEETIVRRKFKVMGKLESARLLCEIKGWKEPEQLVVETGPKTLEALEERAKNVVSALDRRMRKPSS